MMLLLWLVLWYPTYRWLKRLLDARDLHRADQARCHLPPFRGVSEDFD